MTPAQFVDACSARSIRLWLTDEGKLGYAGPWQELTAPVMQTLEQWKEPILSVLHERANPAPLPRGQRYPEPKIVTHVLPDHPLDLFETALSLEASIAWEEGEREREARIGNHLILIAPDDSSLGWSVPTPSDSRIPVYHVSEIDALYKLVHPAETPYDASAVDWNMAMRYHLYRCELLRSWQREAWYFRDHLHRDPKIAQSPSSYHQLVWPHEVARVARVYPTFTPEAAEKVLEVLIAGKWLATARIMNNSVEIIRTPNAIDRLYEQSGAKQGHSQIEDTDGEDPFRDG